MNLASSPPLADVVVPVFNEAEILPQFHQRLRALNLPLNVIYVDNASTDMSVPLIESFGDARLIRHAVNEGYGGSLLDGIHSSSLDKIIIIDADCEYPPEAIPELLQLLETAEVVYTSRFLGSENSFMPFTKRLGNQLITSLFNVLFRQQLTDLYTGCKAFRRSALDGCKLSRKGFEHVLELGVEFARQKRTTTELAVTFTPRHTGEAKMRHLSETLKYLGLVFSYFLTRR